MRHREGPRVLVIGATSAIAQEIVRRKAASGARLFLVGRDAGKLSALAEGVGLTDSSLRLSFDFTRLENIEPSVEQILGRLGGIDEVFVAHGDLGDQLESERNYREVQRLFDVNCLSVLAFLVPLANAMEMARRGHITVITSVAADRGRPRNYTYGAAKAAVNVFLQGLRSRLVASGVGVTTIRLGPVDTPMTRDHAKNRLFARPAEVARSICELRTNGDVYVPGFWFWIMLVVRWLPLSLFQRFGFLSGR